MLAFLGGTGPEGRGLALRCALIGEEIVIGSRDAKKAVKAAEKLGADVPGAKISGAENSIAAHLGDIVFLTVPYEAQKALLKDVASDLSGKVVVSVVAPLVFEGGQVTALQVADGSAAQQIQNLVPQCQVVGAFQNLSATKLLALDQPLDGDVVTCSDYPQAKGRIMAMVDLINDLRAVDGGGLGNSRYVEELTALLLNINRIYKAHSAIRVVGLS